MPRHSLKQLNTVKNIWAPLKNLFTSLVFQAGYGRDPLKHVSSEFELLARKLSPCISFTVHLESCCSQHVATLLIKLSQLFLPFISKQLKLIIKHQRKRLSSLFRRGPWPLRPHSGWATVSSKLWYPSHRVNCRCMISSINICQQLMSKLFIKFSFIHLIRFRVETPLRQRLPMSFHESQYDRWSSRMPTAVSSYSKHVGGCVLPW